MFSTGIPEEEKTCWAVFIPSTSRYLLELKLPISAGRGRLLHRKYKHPEAEDPTTDHKEPEGRQFVMSSPQPLSKGGTGWGRGRPKSHCWQAC